jgi:hypothetical protein
VRDHEVHSGGVRALDQVERLNEGGGDALRFGLLIVHFKGVAIGPWPADRRPDLQIQSRFLRAQSDVVWRFHDHIHAHQPDLIWVGLARALGWQERQAPGSHGRFTFPQTTLGELAAAIARRMNMGSQAFWAE